MTDTNARPANVLPLPRLTLIIHAAQIVFAIIVLGVSAYGVHWIAYNALIFSIVCALLTFAVCAYILATTLFLHNLYNGYIVLGGHLLMLIFWVCQMGLVANLARIWGTYSETSCWSSFGYTYCSYNYKRGTEYSNLGKRDVVPTIKSYWAVLTVGALFGAAELALWAASTVFVVIYLNKHRNNTINNTTTTTTQQPPAYAGNGQSVPMEQKFGQTGVPQQPAPAHQQPPQQYNGAVYQQPQQLQQPYSAAPTPQQQYAQPVNVPQGQYAQQPQYNAPYPQDPVNRTQTVSPVSQAGYNVPPQNTSELATPQHTGNYTYNPNVSELSTPQQTGGHNPNASELSNHK